MPKIIINESLLGHIANDAFLRGSFELEGNAFKNTIGYLQQYLAAQSEENSTPSLQILLEKSLVLSEFDQKIREAPPSLIALAQEINRRIINLPLNDYLLIPGGWHDATGGHSMIYRVTKLEDNELKFSIYNSGSGINFHSRLSHKHKESYHPELSYQLPMEKINDKNFTVWLDGLLSARVFNIHKRHKIEPEYLYQTIFPQLSYFDGQLVESTPLPEHCYTAGQLSGTCTQRSLQQMMKFCFKYLDEYRRFIFHFKLFAFQDYISTCKDSLKHVKHQDLVLHAASHLLSILNVTSTQNDGDLFTIQEKSQHQQQISALTCFDERQTHTDPEYQPMENHEVRLPRSLPAITPRNLIEKPFIPVDTAAHMHLSGGGYLLNELGTLCLHCKTLSPETVFAVIEKALISFPTPNVDLRDKIDFYDAVINSLENTHKFYLLMNELQEYFFKSVQSLGNHIVPRVYAIKLQIHQIIAYVNAHSQLGSDTYSFSRRASKVLFPCIGREIPYLATNDPYLDQFYQKFNRVYPNNQKNHLFLVDYYQGIINSEPQLKKLLEDAYEAAYGSKGLRGSELLNQTRTTSLFFLFKHLDELKAKAAKEDPNQLNTVTYKRLLTKFDIQKEMERAFMNWGAFNAYSHETKNWIPQLVYKERAGEKPYFSVRINDDCSFWNRFVGAKSRDIIVDVRALAATKYNLTPSAPKRALDHTMNSDEIPSDNQVQISPEVYNPIFNEDIINGSLYVFSKNDLCDRMFFHLRAVPETQLILTLNYSLIHLEKFKSTNFQKYVEANLFQPPLLLEQLKKENHDAFLQQFDEFVKAGLRFYERQGQLTDHSLFFIRIASAVYSYAAKMDIERFRVRIKQCSDHMTALINCQNNARILAALHSYRLSLWLACFQSKPHLFASIKNQLISYFMSQTARGDDPDIASKFQNECEFHLFKQILKQHGDQITGELMAQLIQEMRIVTKPFSLTGKYPEFTVQHSGEIFKINAELGLVFKNNMTYCALPLEITTHPIVTRYGLQHLRSGYRSLDGNEFLLETAEIRFRIIKVQNEYVVQRTFTNRQGQEVWHELSASTPGQADYWNIQQFMKLRLPRIFQERESLFWRSFDQPEFLIEDETLQVRFHGNQKQIRDIRQQMRLILDADLLKKITRFEHPKWITLLANSSGNSIELPRYGLTFSGTLGTKQITWEWEGRQYTLVDEPSILGHEVAALKFSANNQTLCLIPIQPFIRRFGRSSRSAYHAVKQDASGIAPSEMIEWLRENPTETAINIPCETAIWQYSNTEQFGVFKLRNGEPIATTSAEAFFLTYLYLGTNKTEKAWLMLTSCARDLGGLSGTYQELQFLHWIITALPYQIDKIIDEKAQIQNPMVVACQLKALSLFVQLHNVSKTIVFPKNDPALTLNAAYHNYVLQQRMQFLKTLNSTIYALYSKFQAMRPELPVAYELSDDETKYLLDYYHQHLPSSDALGALGYEWVRLNLSILRKEYSAMVTKPQLSDYERRRKDEIEQVLANHEGVAKFQSRLVYRPLDLTIPNTLSINKKTLSAQICGYLKNNLNTDSVPNAREIQEARDCLTLDVSDNDFLTHFKTYVWLMRHSEHQDHLALMNFCKATLIAYRHVPLDKQTTNLTLFCNLLFRLSDYKLYRPVLTIENLLTWAKNSLVSEQHNIKIPELVNDVSECLVKAVNLWESLPLLPRKIHVAASIDVGKTSRFDDWFDADLKLKAVHWRTIEAAFRSGQTDTDIQVSNDCGISDEECIAGHVKYQALREMQDLAKTSFDPSTLERIAIVAEKQVQIINQRQTQLEHEILDLAQKWPNDPRLKQRWEIEIAAQKRAPLTLNRLLLLFFHADQNRYSAETGLQPQDIHHLHSLLAQYVDSGLQLQQHHRVLAYITHTQTANSDENALATFLLAQALFAENKVDITKDSALAVFQYLDDLLLRPQQAETMARLLSSLPEDKFIETIEQVIMGGGKSKLIIPGLVQKKANGTNLVVVEVPRSLLRTNFIDLNSTSSKFFNQKAHLFEFNRDTNCSSRHLAQLYEHLTQVMINKDYLITTGDAVQSLELKYLELLRNIPESLSLQQEWIQQVMCAERLVLLFRHRADVIIDEVHQGLLLKHKLNYTLGEPEPISKSITNDAVELYKFFEEVNLDIAGQPTNLYQALLDRYVLTQPAFLKKAIEVLSSQMVNHPHSPLASLISEWEQTKEESIKERLLVYLRNEGTTIPSFIQKADPEIREKIAFYKEQISNLLPFTLVRQQGEHYGPSKLATHETAVRLLAIPYTANDVPNERSRFGNYLVAMNFTIQSLLITGMPKDIFRSMLEDWLSMARKEILDGTASNLDETAMAAVFKAIINIKIPSLKFSQLNLDNETELEDLYQQFKHDPVFIYETLKSKVLIHIKTHQEILHSDAHNHVDLYRSCQGLTGTPSNYSTFHQRLQFSKASGLGTNSYILQGIKTKQPQCYAVDFKHTEQYINGIFTHFGSPINVRAIIDINATFKGISNIKVAQAIAAYIHRNLVKFSQPATVKYLLFFNENNALCALRIQANSEDQIPIVIGSSDPKTIDSRLGCGPESRFTFYDQAHTVGTDVKQHAYGKGIVLIDKDTHLDHFLQGAMRMRGLLEGEQSIDILMPPNIENQSFSALCRMMADNEQRHLQNDNFIAAISKLTNLIRDDLMQRLLQIDGPDAVAKKHAFLKHIEAFFIGRQAQDLFSAYGTLGELRSTAEVLHDHQRQLFDRWQALLSDDHKELAAATTMIEKMQKIIADATVLGVCEANQVVPKALLSDAVEVQQEQQSHIQHLAEDLEERYNSQLKAQDYRSWSFAKMCLKPLNNVIKSVEMKLALPAFSENLLASPNYYKTYIDQTKFIGMFLKPVQALWFYEKNNELFCTLLSQQDCHELLTTGVGQGWICTTQHHLLAGQPPANIRQNPQYQRLIEQVRYFNGELSLLLSEKNTLSWLFEETEEKLEFFKVLYPCRETKESDLRAIQAHFSKRTKIYQIIAKTPWKDYRHTAWKTQFTGLDQEDVDELKELAKAFYHITVGGGDLNIPAVENINLSLQAKGYVIRYRDQIQEFHRFILTLKMDGISPALRDLLANSALDLKELLGKNLALPEHRYLFFKTLLVELPFLHRSAEVWQQVISTGRLSPADLAILLERILHTRGHVAHLLLKAHRQNLSVEHLVVLCQSMTNADLEQLFTEQPRVEIDPELLKLLFRESNLTLTHLELVLKHQKLISEHVALIIQHMKYLMSNGIQEQLLAVVDNINLAESTRQKIKQAQELMDADLVKLINTETSDPLLIRNCLTHPNAQDLTFNALLQKTKLDFSHLQIILDHPHYSALYLPRIKNKLIDEPQLLENKDRLLNYLANIEVLHDLLDFLKDTPIRLDDFPGIQQLKCVLQSIQADSTLDSFETIHQQTYQVLTALLAKIAFLKDNAVIWRALVKNPNLTSQDITQLLKILKHEPEVASDLLSSQTLQLEHVKCLCDSIATYKYAQLDRLINYSFTKETGQENSVLDQLLKQPELRVTRLQTLIKTISLTATNIRTIVANRSFLVDPSIQEALRKTDNEELLAYVNQEIDQCMTMSDEQLASLLKSDETELKLIQFCLRHPNAQYLTYARIVEQRNLTDEIVDFIINQPIYSYRFLPEISEGLVQYRYKLNQQEQTARLNGVRNIKDVHAQIETISNQLLRVNHSVIFKSSGTLLNPVTLNIDLFMDTLRSHVTPYDWENLCPDLKIIMSNINRWTWDDAPKVFEMLSEIPFFTTSPELWKMRAYKPNLSTDELTDLWKNIPLDTLPLDDWNRMVSLLLIQPLLTSNDFNRIYSWIQKCTQDTVGLLLTNRLISIGQFKELLSLPLISTKLLKTVLNQQLSSKQLNLILDLSPDLLNDVGLLSQLNQKAKVYNDQDLNDRISGLSVQFKDLDDAALAQLIIKDHDQSEIVSFLANHTNAKEKTFREAVKTAKLDAVSLRKIMDHPLYSCGLIPIIKENLSQYDMTEKSQIVVYLKHIEALHEFLARISANPRLEPLPYPREACIALCPELESILKGKSALDAKEAHHQILMTMLNKIPVLEGNTSIWRTLTYHSCLSIPELNQLLEKLPNEFVKAAPQLLTLSRASLNQQHLAHLSLSLDGYSPETLLSFSTHPSLSSTLIDKSILVFLSHANLSVHDLKALIQSHALSSAQMKQTLQLPPNFLNDPELLIGLEKQQRQLNNSDLSEKIYQTISNCMTLTDSHLTEMLSTTQDISLMRVCIKHPKAEEDTLRQAILKPDLPSEELIQIINKTNCSHDLLNLIMKKEITDPIVAHSIKQHPKIKEMDAAEKLIQELQALCKGYLIHSCTELHLTSSNGIFPLKPAMTGQPKLNKLADKYDCVRSLYTLLQISDKSPVDRIEEFKNRLQKTTDSLKDHRDNKFIQFLNSLWESLKHFFTRTQTAGFWKPPKSEILRTELEQKVQPKK